MKKLLVLILLSGCQLYEYKTEVIYCEGYRSPITVVYKDCHDPSIRNRKVAVPYVYLGNKRYLNVCDCNVLSKKPIEK